jgi:hypothetical protein
MNKSVPFRAGHEYINIKKRYARTTTDEHVVDLYYHEAENLVEMLQNILKETVQ